MTNAIDVLNEMQNWFKDHKWIQNEAYIDEEGNSVKYLIDTQETIENVQGACLVGALDIAILNLEHNFDRELFSEVHTALGRLSHNVTGNWSTVRWNDTVPKSKEEVIQFIEDAKDLIAVDDPGPE